MNTETAAVLSPGRRVTATVVSVVLASLALAFVVLRMSTPSDGARLDPGHDVWRTQGVVVTPLEPRREGLRAGDVVIAIDGRSMDSLAQALFDPRAPQVERHMGQHTTYTVLRDGTPTQVVVVLGSYPLGRNLAEDWGTLLFGLCFGLVGAFVFARRPRDRAAAALCVCAASLFSATTWSFGLQTSDFTDGRLWWLYITTSLGAYTLAWVAFLHFALVFPQPHVLAARYRWLIPLAYVSVFVGYGVYIIVSRARSASVLSWIGGWFPPQGIVTAIFVPLALAAAISTYRANKDSATRQRIRWLVYGALVSAGGGLFLWFIPTDLFSYPIINANVLGLLALIMPITLSISILRYHLFDIDVLINRTLVYGLLTATLALVYFGTVVSLRGVVALATGKALASPVADSPVAIVASTLLLAALFQPLRRRIQTNVDRRFYRRKYDATRTLATFSATLRNQVELAQLSQHLITVVEDTMQPAHCSLWLRPVAPSTGAEHPGVPALTRAPAAAPPHAGGGSAPPVA